MRILIAPLDWGLGHATRCIPIISYLTEKKCEVIIAADGRALQLLRNEPACRAASFVELPGYNISYPKNGSMAVKMAAQIPKILSGIKKEHKQLKKIIREKKIDAVISDNRFGLWSKDVPCVFITHQLMVKSPFGENLIHKLNKNYISKYSDCWIPDVAGENNLSGDLSHKFPLSSNAKFIGALSRMSRDASSPEMGDHDLLAILSGPEPQRTLFEKKILEQARGCDFKILVVQGVTEKNERRKISDNVEVISYLTSQELHKEINSSSLILCRPGYSSVMDLAVLHKKAIFVPTPGQTEQEYLAKYFSEKKIAYSVSQKKFDLRTVVKESENYSGFAEKYNSKEFMRAADEFLLKCN